MTTLHFDWLEVAILLPLLGALWVRRLRDRPRARRHAAVVSGLALLFAVGAWMDLTWLHVFEAADTWQLTAWLPLRELFVIDELSGPLFPLAALIVFLTILATPRTNVARFSFTAALVAESVLLATFACREPWFVVALLVLGAVVPVAGLRRRGRSARVLTLHMGAFVLLLVGGQALFAWGGASSRTLALALLSAGLFLRCGVPPAHVWVTDLFDRGGFGSTMLFTTPMVGAYAFMRLVVPTAPAGLLTCLAVVALAGSIYCVAMSLVQTDARRFYAYLLLSHSSVVLVGLDIPTLHGLTGGLALWLGVLLAQTGLGLTLRSVEARVGRLRLDAHHGLAPHMPSLAVFFLLTGLAAVGFPGTLGFVGAELLIKGAIDAFPLVGIGLVIGAGLSGVAILHVYFRVFTGARHHATVDLRSRRAERLAALILTLLILGGGLYPQPGVATRSHAARELLLARDALVAGDDTEAAVAPGADAARHASLPPDHGPRRSSR